MDPYSSNFKSAFDQTGHGVTFVDFLPECQKEMGFFTKPIYDDFKTLIGRANDWLRQHPDWDINTCESIELKANSDNVRPEGMIYLENGSYSTWYIRGLRLWIQRCPSGQERVKQIGYFNLIPFEIESGGIFSNPKYESLEEVLARYNDPHQTPPIQGSIITVETQNIKVSYGKLPDPDRCSWVERGEQRDRFIFILRIFFEVSEPKHEVLGITNFLPEAVSTSCCAALNEFEPFSNVIQRASDWISQYSQLKVCTAQSVVTKTRNGTFADPSKMSYTEYGEGAQFFIRYLRIVHVTKQQDDRAPLINRLTCKYFVPMQQSTGGILITTGSMPRFEPLQDTVNRASAWLGAAGADVLSMETSAVRFDRSKGADFCADLSFGVSPKERNEYFIFVIRAFIRGSYTEPVGVELPVVTEFLKGECCAIL